MSQCLFNGNGVLILFWLIWLVFICIFILLRNYLATVLNVTFLWTVSSSEEHGDDLSLWHQILEKYSFFEFSLKHFVHAKIKIQSWFSHLVVPSVWITKENVLKNIWSPLTLILWTKKHMQRHFFKISSFEEESKMYRFGTTNNDILYRSKVWD